MHKIEALIEPPLIPPLRQGRLDSLCGMYAVINSIRLIRAVKKPLRWCDEKHLFHAGIRFLNRNLDLSDVLIEGMPGSAQVRLAIHLNAQANERMNTNFKFQRLRVKASTFAKTIEGEVDAGKPVNVLFSGALDHFSIIAGYSKSRFLLFDSAGHKWVRRDLCQLSGGRGDCRHEIDKQALFVFL